MPQWRRRKPRTIRMGGAGGSRRGAAARSRGSTRAAAGGRTASQDPRCRPACSRATPPLHPLRGHDRSLQGWCGETARRRAARDERAAVRRRSRRRGGASEAGGGAWPPARKRGQGRAAEPAAAEGVASLIGEAIAASAPASAVRAGGRPEPARGNRGGARGRCRIGGSGHATRRRRRRARRGRRTQGRPGSRGARRG